jgi:Rrf2 family protein
MVDLTEHPGEFVPLKDIAHRQDISEKYLETILKALVKEGLLAGRRGKGGGYMLTRNPDEYKVGEVLRATEGSLTPVSCIDNGMVNCDKAASCRIVSLWQGLDDVVNEYLDGVTIADLTSSTVAGDDYVI